MNPPIDKQRAVAIATERVFSKDDSLERYVMDVTEEAEGWWVRWGPPEGWMGGGPNVLVSKTDGAILDVYYEQ